jgi:hypothetical protein
MIFRSAWNRIKALPARAVVLFMILGFAATALLISKTQSEEKEPWDISRLNQIKGRKTPPVLYMSGNYTETWKTAPGSPAPRSGQFEMYIRGTNEYFLKCWHGSPTNQPGMVMGMICYILPFMSSHYARWWRVEVIADDFEATMGRRWGRFGSGGGGGGGEGRRGWFAPGRRLWNQSGFIGALEEGQVNTEVYATETFRKLKKFGDYKLPRLIEFSQRDFSQTFHINKCEFRDSPAYDWFVARKQEYFDSFPAATNPPAKK